MTMAIFNYGTGVTASTSSWQYGTIINGTSININGDYYDEKINNNQDKFEGNMSNTKIRVTISQLLNDLNNGITRCKNDTGYDEKRGSVEEKYGLTKEAVKEIFRHPKLANLRVRIPTIEEKIYELVDDVEEKTEKEVVNENKPKFGEKSASQVERLLEKEEKKEEIKTVSVNELTAEKKTEESF